VIQAGYLAKYQWDRKTEVCHFTYGKDLPSVDPKTIPEEPAKLTPVPEAKPTTSIPEVQATNPPDAKPVSIPEAQPTNPPEPNPAPIQEAQAPIQPEFKPVLEGILSPEIARKGIERQKRKDSARKEDQLENLLKRLRKKTHALKEIVEKYYHQEGYDYVLWNIFYANEMAHKNYSAYLRKALEMNWAYEWREEREVQSQEIYQQQQTKKEERRKEEQLDKDRIVFKAKHSSLPKEIKAKLWNQAEAEVPAKQMGRQTYVKITYANLVREYLNQHGDNFIKEITNPLPLVREMAKEVMEIEGVANKAIQ
jgi:hypothetical protein